MSGIRRALLVQGCFFLGLLLVGLSAGTGVGDDEAPNPIGKPKAFKAGKASRYAVWHDDGTWHIQVTALKGKRDVFTGSVRASKGRIIGKFEGLEKGEAADADWVFPSRDGGGFDFRLVNIGKVDSLSFQVSPDAVAIAFDLQIDGVAHPEKVLIGRKGGHPGKNPFVLPARPAE